MFGTFYRRFALPAGADAERVSATCTNGVLEVVIPKEEALKPRRIEVSG
ncbi:MAG: Hsp20 family protein [Gammaproteobacteria bacterium]|nr:Hsp20 family protein [Gammaproteobacteria bacterium]NIR84802.1 Hsp20 family protein [Gammaproteobacteria bacterium]NIR91516.1 Hsp20 family protein [Gammaproteobacteria bacterium]NIU05849.1 Hsp20 family protein [Gammaproteobacteria bacterium]NIV76704.1 Hsp20 family protein [Gammaproteobacteria bacterium]